MNIVFAFADDWGKYANIYNEIDNLDDINSLLKTPNINRIAHEGVSFTNAFVPAPSCTPCRSSVCSGQYFWQTGLGAILVGAHWDTDIPTYPLELEKNGYHIGYTYKVWSPGDNADAPYGGIRNCYTRNTEKFTRLGEFNRFSFRAMEKIEELGFDVETAKSAMLVDVRDNFNDFIKANTDNKPFCYWWGPTNTHRDWLRGSGKELWGIEPDDLKGKLPKCLPDVHEVREDFADYLGEVQAFDAGIGVLIDELEKLSELDNTLFVISGDHGIPGMPRGKCNLYNLGCEVALFARFPKLIKENRIVEDFVNIMDLAPTFLDVAGVNIPEQMTAKSILPLLKSDKNGIIDKKRDFIVTGRERHADIARDGNLPYPQRAIRTKDYLYIYNFEPDRWPVGDPKGLQDPSYQIDFDELRLQSSAAFNDMDASPTKAWLIWHRNEEAYKNYYSLAFDKRPKEELYILNNDKDTVLNVAQNEKYANVKKELNERLFKILHEQNDPRVIDEDCRFEHLPYTSVRIIKKKQNKG
ncbi:MAG: sulfatase [Clostridia bacterium]